VSAVLVVARGVFKESIRDRIGYNLVFFAVLLMAASILLAQVTAGQDVKIIKDLGLAAATAIGVMLAVFIGISLVSKEVERRSIYSLLSKPITRTQFILGKYLGLVFTLVVNLSVMVLAYYAVLWYLDWQTPALASQGWEAPAADPRLLKAFALIGVELMLVTALALFFSTFSNTFLSAGLTIAVYVIGHFNADLKNLSSLSDSPVLIAIGKGLYYALPNLTLLDVKAEVVHAHAVSGQQMLTGMLSAGLYIGLLVTASIIVFSRRDFK
jgi:ABC-type transport system involved in multi-copper enzyme maturation permease subunit